MEAIQFIQSFANPFLDVLLSLITNLGGQLIGLFIACYILWCKDKEKGYLFLYTVIFSFCTNNILKGIVNSKRPIGTPGINSSHIETATGSSFPSGHSQGNGATFGFLMREYKNVFLWIIGIFMLVAVPISRLYFGVHWPVDVIVGTLIGIFCVFLCSYLFSLYKKYGFYIIIINLIFFILLGFILPSDDLFKSLGSFCAFTLALYLDNEFIKYNPVDNKRRNLIKLLLGIIVSAIIYFTFELFGSSLFLSFTKYFLLCIWATAMAPFLFKKFKI